MAGPMAAGLYLLAREYLREEKGIANPNSQLVKALLINGAVRMDPDLYAYPGWDQGWGRIDLPNSLFPKPPKTVQFQEGTITTTGATWNPTSINLNVASGTVPLKITLVWIDAIGPALVRDLNLQVTSPGGLTYCGNNYAAGWSRSFAGPTCAAGNTTWDTDGNGWDQVNNVEQVEVQSPAAGMWAVQVRGWSVPSPARFAVVVSADVGPQSQYRVAVSTTSPTTFSIAPAGSANLPFHVSNFGTSADSVLLTASTPGGITVRFSPTGPISVPRAGGEDVLASIQVAAGVVPGLYQFNLQGTSNLDPNPAGPSSDFIQVTVEVTTTKVPFPIIVANGTTDELDPSVVVFNSTAGVRQMFVAYRRTGPVLLGGRLGGVNVWVAHTTLDNNGMPVLPFQQASVSSANDLPNDLRLLRIPSGTFTDRVVITWTGTDPNVTNPDAASYGRIAYADAPYTTWNLRTIETNIGSSNFNVARVSFPLFRRAGGGNGELMWVFEHLDYVTLTGNPVRVQTHVTISIDGGNSWPVPIRIFPVSGADTNFYFFPHGTVDQNDVAWVFAYFRTPTGNNRDLALRLYDGIWSTTAPVVFNTVDNIQWPAVLSTAEGPFNNRVYAVVTRDNNAVDLKLWMVYINGTALPWSSARVPRAAPLGDNCGVACSISLDFAGPYGPFGLSASNANYNRRPILNLVKTVEGANTFVWLPYMDNGNPYSTPNLWTYYGTEGSWVAKAPSLTKITSDGYAKGHQMTDTLTTGAVALLQRLVHPRPRRRGELGPAEPDSGVHPREHRARHDATDPRRNRERSPRGRHPRRRRDHVAGIHRRGVPRRDREVPSVPRGDSLRCLRPDRRGHHGGRPPHVHIHRRRRRAKHVLLLHPFRGRGRAHREQPPARGADPVRGRRGKELRLSAARPSGRISRGGPADPERTRCLDVRRVLECVVFLVLRPTRGSEPVPDRVPPPRGHPRPRSRGDIHGRGSRAGDDDVLPVQGVELRREPELPDRIHGREPEVRHGRVRRLGLLSRHPREHDRPGGHDGLAGGCRVLGEGRRLVPLDRPRPVTKQ